MYQAEALSVYPYFQRVLESVPLASVQDALTGLISREYMLDFIRDLIRRDVPFTLGIIDLDNFKSINDNYGHVTGDGVLSQFGEALRTYLGGDGLAGRFGGDEFLFVYLKSNDYQHIHDFYSGFYAGKRLFRRDYTVNGIKVFLTGTVGSASYPDDAMDFDTLISMVDKTLYRGKSKGRNCYIIYVEAKHAHLEIPKLAKRSLFDTLRKMADGFDRGRDENDRLRRAFSPAREDLRLSSLMYLSAGGVLEDLISGEALGNTGTLDSLMENGLYASNSLDEITRVNPALAEALRKKGLQAAIFLQAERKGRGPGWLVFCPEPHTMHIWQDEEYTAAFFLSRLLTHETDG